MGTLYKGLYRRGNTFWLRYTVAGKQVRMSLDTEHEGDAVAKALEIRKNPELSPVNEAGVELEEYLRDSLAFGSLTANSVESRKKVLEKFLREYSITSLAQISTAVAQQWYSDLIKPGEHQVTETTARGYIWRLRGFVSWLVKKNKLRTNPAAEVKLKRYRTVGRKNILTADQVAELIKDAPTDDLKFILFAGFHAGMRRGEIIEARPSWFNLAADSGSISIPSNLEFMSKDDQPRTVPLTKAFKKFLKRYGKGKTTYMLQPDVEKWQAKYRYDFRRPFEEYIAAKKMKCTAHDMRRTFASLRAQAGVDIYKIAKWLGDDVEVVQRHYGHLSLQDDDIEIG